MVFRKKWHDLVKLIEGARPAVDKHKRQNPLVLTVRWPHMDEVNIQSCVHANKKALVVGKIAAK